MDRANIDEAAATAAAPEAGFASDAMSFAVMADRTQRAAQRYRRGDRPVQDRTATGLNRMEEQGEDSHGCDEPDVQGAE